MSDLRMPHFSLMNVSTGTESGDGNISSSGLETNEDASLKPEERAATSLPVQSKLVDEPPSGMAAKNIVSDEKLLETFPAKATTSKPEGSQVATASSESDKTPEAFAVQETETEATGQHNEKKADKDAALSKKPECSQVENSLKFESNTSFPPVQEALTSSTSALGQTKTDQSEKEKEICNRDGEPNNDNSKKLKKSEVELNAPVLSKKNEKVGNRINKSDAVMKSRNNPKCVKEETELGDSRLKGWVIHHYSRPPPSKHIDRYWFSPTGKKLRSRPEVEKFLTFLQESNGDEELAFKTMKTANKRPKRETKEVKKQTPKKKVVVPKTAEKKKKEPKKNGVSENKLSTPKKDASLKMAEKKKMDSKKKKRLEKKSLEKKLSVNKSPQKKSSVEKSSLEKLSLERSSEKKSSAVESKKKAGTSPKKPNKANSRISQSATVITGSPGHGTISSMIAAVQNVFKPIRKKVSRKRKNPEHSIENDQSTETAPKKMKTAATGEIKAPKVRESRKKSSFMQPLFSPEIVEGNTITAEPKVQTPAVGLRKQMKKSAKKQAKQGNVQSPVQGMFSIPTVAESKE